MKTHHKTARASAPAPMTSSTAPDPFLELMAEAERLKQFREETAERRHAANCMLPDWAQDADVSIRLCHSRRDGESSSVVVDLHNVDHIFDDFGPGIHALSQHFRTFLEFRRAQVEELHEKYGIPALDLEGSRLVDARDCLMKRLESTVPTTQAGRFAKVRWILGPSQLGEVSSNVATRARLREVEELAWQLAAAPAEASSS